MINTAPTSAATSGYLSRLKAYDARFADTRYQASLVSAYADAFADLEKELDKLMARVASGEEGLSFDLREKRMRALLSRYQDTIKGFESTVLSQVHSSQKAALQQALSSTKGQLEQLMGRSPTGVMPPTLFDATSWSRFNKQALNAVTSMFSTTSSPLRQLIGSLGDDTMRLVRSELQKGILLGRNPLKIASRIKNGTANIALGRARVIARTEFHRAYRMAQREQYKQSSVVKGWVWKAKLDPATCSVCVIMAGTLHETSEMLDGHPACRCVMVPLTPTWGELLGIHTGNWDVPPATFVPSGADWLKAQGPEAMRRILGKSRYESSFARILKGESFDSILQSFVEQRYSPIWGSMRTLRNLTSKIPPPPPPIPTFTRTTTTQPITKTQFKTEAPATRSAWEASGASVMGNTKTDPLIARLMDDAYLGQVVGTDWARKAFYFEQPAAARAAADAMWSKMTTEDRIAWFKGRPNDTSLYGMGETQLRDLVRRASQTWSGTSGDHNADALAFQKAVADEFGLQYGSHLTTRSVWGSIDAAQVEVLRVVARATYQMTQELLQAQGIEYVTLARGQGYSAFESLKGKPAGYHEPTDFELQPASSFSSNLGTAEMFGDLTVTMRIHRTNVLSLTGHGFGTGYEEEWLLLGGTYHGMVTIDHVWRGY